MKKIFFIMLLSFLVTTASSEAIDKKVKGVVNNKDQNEDKSYHISGDTIKLKGDSSPKAQNVKEVKNRKKEKSLKAKKQAISHLQYEPKQRMGPNSYDPLPNVIFHGFKQSCSEKKLVENVKYIQEGTEGHTECIEIGDGATSSIFMSLVKQAKEACKKINEHPIFRDRQFNVIGLSQGALLARYIVETCQTKFPIRNLITLGGPNNGMELGSNTDCSDHQDNFRCQIKTRIGQFPMLNQYSKVIQSTLGPTNYMRDFQHHQMYLDHALFLPYVNNEKEHNRVEQNKLRFESLNSLTMIMFTRDNVVFPKESSWFGQVDPAGKVVPMEATDVFSKNLFGLQTLAKEGRIFAIEKDGDHLEYGPEYIKSVIVPALLR